MWKLRISKSFFLHKLFAFIGIALCVNFNSGCDYQFQNKEKLGRNYAADLTGYWKFSIGDDSAWASPDYDDDDWEEIKVPSNWEDQGYYGYNGFAWYRKTFEISDDFKDEDLYLNLGVIDDVDETYFNGTMVGLSGGFPPYYLTAYNAVRNYYIPKQLVKIGKNTIAVRVYDIQLEGGIIKGPINIYSIRTSNNNSVDLVPDINLTGRWKFMTGDNTNWKKPELNDSAWKNLFVPGLWEAQGFGDYDGFAWYRKSFFVPAAYSNTKMVLLMGKIDDIDQTYLNGELAGEIGDWNPDLIDLNFNQHNEWEIFRAYFLPDGILKPGEENNISVRVFDGMVDGGIYDGPIGLITQEKYVAYWKGKKHE